MQNISLQNLFLLDIETVSAKEKFELLDDNWKDLWTAKIQRSLPPDATPEEYYPLRAGIFAEFAKVICISFGYFKKEEQSWKLRIKSLCSSDEYALLNDFNDTLIHFHQVHKNWIFCGHNIKEFDVPFLCRRMLANGIAVPSFFDFQNKRPWETPILDTLHLWRFGDYKNYTSLRLLAAVLSVPSPKDDIDGSEVGNVFWKENDLDRISAYCEKDVLTVGNIILKCKNLPILEDHQVAFVR